MTFKGTVSDLDGVGLFGLIIADDGRVLPFNLRGTPPPLRSRFEIGTRVTFRRRASEPIARAVEVAPIDEWDDGGSANATAPERGYRRATSDQEGSSVHRDCICEHFIRHKPLASEEYRFRRRRGQPMEPYVVIPSAWQAGERAWGVHRGSVVSAESAPKMRILNGKVGYYADFIIYGMLVVAFAALISRESRSDQLIWLAAAVAGAASWTLVEYFLHRFVFHRMPLIADLHHAHHVAPRAYVSTPTWASLLILVGVFFVPIWRLVSLNVAFGAISGLITGWLWYGVVHHAIHYRRPRRLTIALRAASHRHLLHHSPYHCGNFGVTTGVWDYLFGTHISLGARAVNVAAQRPESMALRGRKTL